MNYLKRCFFFAACICLVVSCSEICEGECYELRTVSMRIISSIDSTDLVFGESNIYELNDLRLFSLDGVDSTFFNIDTINLGNPNLESYMFFDHESFTVSRLFIDYGDSDIDTLDFDFINGDCCEKLNRYLGSATQNNVSVYNHDEGSSIVTLLK